MKSLSTLFISLWFCLLPPFTSFGQLRLSEFMKGNEFIGHQPDNGYWSPDGETIYFEWNPSNELLTSSFSYDLTTGSIRLIRPEESKHILPANYITTEDEKVFYKKGKTLFAIEDTDTTIIFQTSEPFTILDHTKKDLLLSINRNIYLLHTDRPGMKQITHFVETTPSGEQETTPNYLSQEEASLFKTIRTTEAKKEARKNRSQAARVHFPASFGIGKANISDALWSCEKETLIFVTVAYPDGKDTEYMDYINTDGYAKSRSARAKVGTSPTPVYTLYHHNQKEDTTICIDLSKLSGINRLPEYFSAYPDSLHPKDYIKKPYIHLHGLNDSEDKALIEIKSDDNKDRWIGYVDLRTATFTEINHQHDEAWIGGPGITGWNMVPGNVGWMSDNTCFYQSEKTGYSHLYTYDITKKNETQLTSGNYEIHTAEWSKKKERFYITANKNHPGNREFYHLNPKTKNLTPILTQNGNHDVTVSPDENQLLVRYSTINTPWELYICDNKPNAQLTPITNSQSEAFKKTTQITPDIITFQAKDGKDVYARLYTPEKENKNNAAVFFVHGAGYLQNAHQWWSGYYREYFFNQYLCKKGYTVMDIDYRASAGYGRDWRTAIYRDMGGNDLDDYIDARAYLIENHGIHPEQVGIYGGSYGGFISIMALLKHPGKFQCGAAIRSVTDWAHYNGPYTSNILNTPQHDPIAYRRSSPIYYADQLEDQLLMLHGMVDNNVQYQDVVRLSQLFIEKGKKTWDLIGYPVEPHGFVETASWVDEYSRIERLFDEHLLK